MPLTRFLEDFWTLRRIRLIKYHVTVRQIHAKCSTEKKRAAIISTSGLRNGYSFFFCNLNTLRGFSSHVDDSAP